MRRLTGAGVRQDFAEAVSLTIKKSGHTGRTGACGKFMTKTIDIMDKKYAVK